MHIKVSEEYMYCLLTLNPVHIGMGNCESNPQNIGDSAKIVAEITPQRYSYSIKTKNLTGL